MKIIKKHGENSIKNIYKRVVRVWIYLIKH